MFVSPVFPCGQANIQEGLFTDQVLAGQLVHGRMQHKKAVVQKITREIIYGRSKAFKSFQGGCADTAKQAKSPQGSIRGMQAIVIPNEQVVVNRRWAGHPLDRTPHGHADLRGGLCCAQRQATEQ